MYKVTYVFNGDWFCRYGAHMFFFYGQESYSLPCELKQDSYSKTANKIHLMIKFILYLLIFIYA